MNPYLTQAGIVVAQAQQRLATAMSTPVVDERHVEPVPYASAPILFNWVLGAALPPVDPASMPLVIVNESSVPQSTSLYGPDFELANNFYQWSQGHLLTC